MLKILVSLFLLVPLLYAKDTNDFFFSYSKSDRKNEAITVIAEADILYNNSAFQTIQMSKRFFDEYDVGFVFDLDEQASEILSYAGYLSNDRWLFSVEQAKLSGEFVKTTGVFDRFENNNYLDIKIMKKPENSIEKNVMIGVQYLTYDRPSALKFDDTAYYDKKAKTQFLGVVFELDSVKYNLIEGESKSRNDWYFYNTTAMGLGNISLSNDTRLVSNKAKANPKEDSWTGIGLNGEYELGYVRYQKTSFMNFAFKIGYYISLEGPVMFHDKSFEMDDVRPDEQLLTQGINFTLMSSF